jgi:hypothetical protein
MLFCALGGIALGWVAGSARAEPAAPNRFRIIINSENPAASAPRDFLEGAFLKKVSRWEDGERIRPVDQVPDAAVRHAFSNEVLKRPTAAVRSYWLQRIFSGGNTPPPELDSDEAVIRFVAKYRGAVGYVSASAKLDHAKVIAVR